MKRNKIVFIFIVLVILLFSNTSYAEDAYAMSSKPSNISTTFPEVLDNSNICMSTEYAKKLVVELKKCRLEEKSLISCTNSNIELTQQISLLREEVELLKQKYTISENLLLKDEEIYKQKVKVINDELIQAQKTRWGSLFGAGAVGAALMGLAFIVL
jgi:hypothetical protein